MGQCGAFADARDTVDLPALPPAVVWDPAGRSSGKCGSQLWVLWPSQAWAELLRGGHLGFEIGPKRQLLTRSDDAHL